MSEKESQVGTCVECSAKEGDSSEKKVSQCELCDRGFCEKHRKPRLVYIKDFKAIDDSRETRALFFEISQYQDGHPDFAYTRRRIMGLDIDEQKQNELIRKALDAMNEAYRERRELAQEAASKDRKKERPYHLFMDEPRYSKKDFPIGLRWSIASLLVLLAGLGLFLYGFTDAHLALNVSFISFPIPFWTIGLILVLSGGLGLLASFR